MAVGPAFHQRPESAGFPLEPSLPQNRRGAVSYSLLPWLVAIKRNSRLSESLVQSACPRASQWRFARQPDHSEKLVPCLQSKTSWAPYGFLENRHMSKLLRVP